MSKRFMNSTLSRSLLAGAVVVACVGGTAMPASAAADPAAAMHTGTGTGALQVQFPLKADERAIYQNVGMESVELQEDKLGSPVLVAKWNEKVKDSIASASFAIVDRSWTGYYAVTTIHGGYVWGMNAWAECDIYKGKPGNGGTVVTDSAYTCETTRHGTDNDWDYLLRRK